MTGPEEGVLAPGLVVRVGGRDAAVERVAGTPDRPIVRLSGCATREDAEALRGTPLLVPRSVLPALEGDEFWAEDLVGCAVTDGDRRVGEVARMLALPSVEVLEVVLPDGPPLLVPLVRDAIRSVDVPARRVDIDLEFLDEA